MKEPILYRTVRPMITFLMKVLYRPTISGRKNIPTEGSIVLAGNHTNDFDPVLLFSSTKRTIHFLAKDSLLKGWKKIIFANLGLIPVDRSRQTNQEVVESAIKILEHKRVIGIFPESTINRAKEDYTLPFKTGAVRMCAATGATIVPFVITGEYKIFRKRVRIDFLEPYKITGDIEEENQKLREIISSWIKNKQEEK